jgi:hypothetical protein
MQLDKTICRGSLKLWVGAIVQLSRSIIVWNVYALWSEIQGKFLPLSSGSKGKPSKQQANQIS